MSSVANGQVLMSLFDENHEFGEHPVEIEMFEAIDKEFSERDKEEIDEEILILQEYVDSIVQVVNPLSDTSLSIRVYIERSPMINAGMYPDGRMQIHLGLLHILDNEAELAYVICHELSHYILRHSLRAELDEEYIRKKPRITFNEGLALRRAFGDYNVGHEKEADALGIEILSATDYSLEAALTSFDKLPKPDTIGGMPWIIEAMLGAQHIKTHPYNHERVRHVSDLISDLNDTKVRVDNAERYKMKFPSKVDNEKRMFRQLPFV